MRTPSPEKDWRYGVRHSRLFVLLWSALPQHAQIQRAKIAYAMALGKPIRLLVLEGVRLPEELCVGYPDVQVARIGDPQEAAQQCQRWLEELDAREKELNDETG